MIGLVAAGVGTMAFLRNTLITNLDTSLSEAVATDVASGLIEITVEGGQPSFAAKDDVAPSETFVALYGPDGALIITAGGEDPEHAPVLPETFSLQRTGEDRLEPFPLESTDGRSGFRAAVDIYPISGVSDLYTQLIARPVAPINQVVGTFIGIYGILALITIIASALVTRWLVTLTFRSLGQVETTAMAIAAGDFSQRMTDIEPETTEVGRLKTALNAMLGRVDAAITQRDSTVRQMRRFIGDASHELRTPLVTVRGYAELYRMGAIAGDEDTAQAMVRIESEAKRMGLLVEDLLALARLDERRDVLFGPVDLRPVARDAALDVRATSPQRAVTVIDTTIAEGTEDASEEAPPEEPPDEPPRRRGAPATARTRASATLSLLRRRPRPVPATQARGVGEPPVAPMEPPTGAGAPPRTPPVVLGDENRIRQVVANLLGNARRFSPEDSPIELRVGVDTEAGMGWIEVADHGEGVPDQIKDKIFQRFWRADTSRARETGGTGLGLSIVASIIEALHGRVFVTDTPGGGATFHVAFPLAQARDADEHRHIETQPIERLRLDEYS